MARLVNFVLDEGCMAATHGGLLAGLDRVEAPCRLIAPAGPVRAQEDVANVRWEPIDWNSPRRTTARHLLALLGPGDRTIVAAGPRNWHTVTTAAAHGPTLCALHASPSSMESELGPELLTRVATEFQALQTDGRLQIVVTDPGWLSAYERRCGWTTDTVSVATDAPSLAELADEIWQARERVAAELDAARRSQARGSSPR